jgi:hypothetical protein
MNWNRDIGRTAAADHARLRADELEVLARLRGRRGSAGCCISGVAASPGATRGTVVLFSELPRRLVRREGCRCDPRFHEECG